VLSDQTNPTPHSAAAALADWPSQDDNQDAAA